MRVKAAISSTTLDFGYIETARHGWKTPAGVKRPLRHPPTILELEKALSGRVRTLEVLQLAEAFWIAIFKAVHCSSKIDFACQRPIALAEYLRHSFANPKTRSLHEIEQRWLFRQLEKALSS